MNQALVSQIIYAIGGEHFAAATATATCRFLQFDLAAMFIHRRDSGPEVLFHDFDGVGCNDGIENYVRFTHRINPMLIRPSSPGACRARDFRGKVLQGNESVRAHLLDAADEELGFRTLGWPERLEEVGLYFEACGGMIELSLYRERTRRAVTTGKLRALEALRSPMKAALERHRALRPVVAPVAGKATALTRREREVCDLMLVGCSSEAIALRLGISRNTVKDYRKQLFRKLRIGSLAELFALNRRGAPPSPGGLPHDADPHIMPDRTQA